MSTPFYDLASLVVVPSGYKSGKIYAQKPLTTDGQLTFTRASTATRVNASGLIETVSSGVPRLDYQGSTCPKLLLEPQRTNVILRSQEQTDAQYAAVINEIASRVAVANPLTGANNAYKITSTANSDPYMGQVVTGLSNGNNTFSLWLWTDSGQSTEATLFFYNAAVTEVYSKVITLTTTPTRYTHSVNFASMGASATVRLDLRQTGAATYLYTYGWQAEGGAYATSYIPTTSAAVTRLADQALLNNSAALPTAYPFTLFAQINYDRAAESQYPICLIDSSTADTYVNIGLGFVGSFEPSATIRTPSTSITVPGNTTIPAGNNKLAIVVTSANIKIYANGALLNTGTNTLAFNSGMNDLLIGQLRSIADTGTRQKLTQQVIVFKSALTEAQAKELTTL